MGAQPGMDVVDKEVFGPVVDLFVYDELEEAVAVAAANAGPNGFQAAVFSRSVDWMPFGGRHQSGLGMGGVKYSIEEMTHPKLIVLNL